jgi:hypothetical protein
VPLLYDMKVVGRARYPVQHRNAFTEDDRLIFEAVADNIATAIHNADLYRPSSGGGRWRMACVKWQA